MLHAPDPLQRARQYEREEAEKSPSGERPLFHLTPMVGWMNDPNGFCYYHGEYHLFYQYHPYTCQWGPMHWGHATSRDLLHWTYLPCAMAPDQPYDVGGCFSGSAVETEDGHLLLMYTGVQPAGTLHRELQTQCIAVGDGTNFEKILSKPVIEGRHLPDGYSHHDFRDPHIWREDGMYYCVVGNRHQDHAGSILLFESRDALEWQFVKELDHSDHAYGEMWECPDFFALDGKQVLLVSPQEMRAREEFHAGFGTVALLGSYDRKTHTFVRESVQPVDHGLNFYAPQTLLTPDGRRVMIGWMENWETCKEAKRTHGYYAQMSVPREVTVRNGRLCQRPVREMESLWQDTISYRELHICERTQLAGIRGRKLDMSVKLIREDVQCRRFTLHLAEDASRETIIRCDLARGELTLDRSRGGSTRDIVHTRHVAAPLTEEGTLSLRILMDMESLELFIGEGERVVTSLITTPQEADGISMEADAPLQVQIEAHHLG